MTNLNKVNKFAEECNGHLIGLDCYYIQKDVRTPNENKDTDQAVFEAIEKGARILCFSIKINKFPFQLTACFTSKELWKRNPSPITQNKKLCK